MQLLLLCLPLLYWPVLYRPPALFQFSLESSLVFLVLFLLGLKLLFQTILQEAESALNARIQDPIFHRVRDVAPNKVSLSRTTFSF